jgi:hypothetical protein
MITNAFDQVFTQDNQVINSNNNIFYHMFCINDAVQRFLTTYEKIENFGLINHIQNIYINCVGPNKIDFSKQIIQQKNIHKLVISVGSYDKGEAETLDLLRNFAIKNPTGNILYLHSKGVWRLNNTKAIKDFTISSEQLKTNVQSWIDCMEYFLIEKYKDCFNYLDIENYETCGIFFKQDNYIKNSPSLYCGNFWWSKNLYIRKLKPCLRNNRWNAEYRFLSPANSKYKDMFKYKGSDKKPAQWCYKTYHNRCDYAP